MSAPLASRSPLLRTEADQPSHFSWESFRPRWRYVLFSFAYTVLTRTFDRGGADQLSD
jgi:hypothetical protein